MDDLLKDALRLIAADAQPEAGTAERALRRASRRRRTQVAATVLGAAAATAAVAVPFALPSPAAPPPPAVRPASGGVPASGGLPANTAEQLALARSCFNGDPVVSRRGGVAQKPDNRPGGRAQDFRLLTSFRHARGQVLFLGSVSAFRLCHLDENGLPSRGDLAPDHPAPAWARPPATPPAGILVDLLGGMASDQQRRAPVLYEMAGRVNPKVVRLVVTWRRQGGGAPPVTTVVRPAGGFFVSAVPAASIAPPWKATVEGFDAAGRRVIERRPAEDYAPLRTPWP
ncbi:hypothetical protein [Actinomadura macrotermitis]|uniref:Uncharacterized protein n=1 Tax=Actinomadura macrotermitis TaxID=2585200 RepID=A0A7K0BWW5_9ACTN|nr:hypothetical protein [Actinomadura macrotermitis]MQY05670.1 hypothetical protein [Actinomadura macrotermitis]